MASLHDQQRFWNIVDSNQLEAGLQDVAVDLASDDPDLNAFYELRIDGFTNSVNPTRADILEDYDEEQLRIEVRERYFLSLSGIAGAVNKTKQRIKKSSDDIE